MGEWQKSKLRRYSVYRAKDDTPIIISGTAKACAEALGIRLNSFFIQVIRARDPNANHSRYVIYEDGVEGMECG